MENIDLGKISEDRLFLNNTKEEIRHWCQHLKYFYFMRARGGHNCEGDSFCAYFRYETREDLVDKLALIGVTINKLEDGFIAFDPLESYSIDDLDKLKITIPHFSDLEQPQYVEVFGQKAHIWVMNNRFEISISGAKDGQTYKVSESDFNTCLALEKEFDKLGWPLILDKEIENQSHCISRKKYPELF
ncbi:hypothetical protein M2451_001451 [Dysgonomonas sp. PFB1-18]|uniref:hypothetical protein n=1 Tax=unclassified Dysgonomonas TaxID=2630389 RepID=UPI002473F8B2|nr:MULTISPECIES: hypothetical protein [unclassified Dysgonomonas]MDH6308885.1 hypothetical protein [Dysgonomonas sp. PF1-14]MDH6338419.1 hypothetical protein [Dysgonomonas sp. PF1-16]MDH6380134.1 hypothetical protein [Dysgonomonas sp. PFB1-18]MDH6397247.1 hypothetical protein [Dysgonomonas sp. PF1-23]